MPNHCDSDLTVTGPDAAIEEFLARFCTDNAPDLNAIRPYPQRFRDLDRAAQDYAKAHPEAPWGKDRPTDGFNSGGYDWCVKNWGTKWGCYEGGEPERQEGMLVLHFETAWGPFSTDLLQIVSAALPTLTFQYDSYERGMGFQCHLTVEGGEVRDEATADYRGNRGG